MKILAVFAFMYFAIINIANTATFIPIPFYKQAEESHGAIRAVYIGSVGKKLKNHEIVTEASFRVLESAGIGQNEIKNKESFKIIYPGGVWEGVGSYVSGAPNFEPNEEVVLLIRKSSVGYILNGFTLGKYSVKYEENGKAYLTSSVFPDHAQLGKIDFSSVEETFKNIFGEKLSAVQPDKFIHTASVNQVRNTNGRGPASFVTNEDAEEENGFWGLFALVVLFTMIGCITTLTIRREKNK